jgi:methanogenic corrinoid protein MtbC1
MERLLTTKELGRAIGASESSLRRWTDGGAIRTARTVGGHRRIALSEAVRFIRATGATVVDPSALGVDELASAGATADDAGERLYAALRDGDAARTRGVVLALYLGGRTVAAIGDGPLRAAMDRLGTGWEHDPSRILVEHRATDLCVAAIAMLRQLTPAADAAAPLAIGGAPQGDPYVAPSAIVAAVLAEEGFRETNFGPHSPVELLAPAARDRGARLVWLSVTAEPGPDARRAIGRLARDLGKANVSLAVGGRGAAGLGRLRSPGVRVLDSLEALAAFGREIRGARPA